MAKTRYASASKSSGRSQKGSDRSKKSVPVAAKMKVKTAVQVQPGQKSQRSPDQKGSSNKVVLSAGRAKRRSVYENTAQFRGSITLNGATYEIGEIVWAKVAGSPYWPAIIAKPEVGASLKVIAGTAKACVQFYGYVEDAKKSAPVGWTNNVVRFKAKNVKPYFEEGQLYLHAHKKSAASAKLHIEWLSESIDEATAMFCAETYDQDASDDEALEESNEEKEDAESFPKLRLSLSEEEAEEEDGVDVQPVSSSTATRSRQTTKKSSPTSYASKSAKTGSKRGSSGSGNALSVKATTAEERRLQENSLPPKKRGRNVESAVEFVHGGEIAKSPEKSAKSGTVGKAVAKSGDASPQRDVSDGRSMRLRKR